MTLECDRKVYNLGYGNKRKCIYSCFSSFFFFNLFPKWAIKGTVSVWVICVLFKCNFHNLQIVCTLMVYIHIYIIFHIFSFISSFFLICICAYPSLKCFYVIIINIIFYFILFFLFFFALVFFYFLFCAMKIHIYNKKRKWEASMARME